MKLENWCVLKASVRPCRAPEKRPESLQGEVYGHPVFADGTDYVTRRIIGITWDGSGAFLVWVRRSHGRGLADGYRLGQAAPEYERRYPDAKGRLFRHLMTEQTKRGGLWSGKNGGY